MKSYRLSCLLASLLLLPALPIAAQKCVPLKDRSENNLVFKGGEKIVFTLHYKWGVVDADVATATVRLDTTVINGKKVFHGSLRGNTQKIYQKIFTVKEDFDTWFTREGLRPVKATRSCKEGNYVCTNLYYYRDKYIDAKINSSKRGEFTVNLPLDDCTYDIPLLFYIIRNMDDGSLRPGGRYPMTYACDHHVKTLQFTYIGKENRKVPGVGTVRCRKFAFEVAKGELFSGDSDLYIWLSDDGNRIPVWFSAPLKVGQVQGRLKSWDNLKNPFSSIIK